MNQDAFHSYFAENRERHIDELKSFLRIPSMSSIPASREDVRRAAAWVQGQLLAVGVPEVQIMETGGHPVVIGHWHVADSLPTILIYGHFDTQPVDPLALWQTPPFEPQVRDGRIYARGAADDKGNMFVPVKALEALKALRGAPPVNLKFLLEGEEEIGSPNLPSFIAQHSSLLEADLAVSADGSMFAPGTPSLTLSSKGLAAMQIDLKGAKGDLHSGGYGGAVPNPIHAMARLLASMRSTEGRVLVEGFYDDVVELDAGERTRIAAVPYSEEQYMTALELTGLFGEPGYSTMERLWVRPTLEVNGIWGGFQDEGVKTVLPNEAHAKITCRLVADQEPERILDLLEAHVRKNLQPGITARMTRFPGSSRPYHIGGDHPAMTVAAEVLADVFGQQPLHVRMGGTLPVAQTLEDVLGLKLLFFAFGSPDEQVHAPNEFYRLESFDRGVRAYVKLLDGLAKAPLK